jgi:Transposase
MLEVAWVGVDVGKAHHWVVVEDSQGRVVLSRRVANDQQEIAGWLPRSPSWPGGWSGRWI